MESGLSGWGGGQQPISALAANGVHAVIDGQYTDGTAVANAVGSGASEVVMVMNSMRNLSNTSDPTLGTRLLALFKGGPPPTGKSANASTLHRDMIQVFASPTAKQVEAGFGAWHRLALPPSSKYLTQLAVGTIKATTAENPYFPGAIAKGRAVTVHVVSVGSSLDIGEFENFVHYDALVQEVALALVDADNKAYVQGTLLPLFQGTRAVEVEAA